MIPRLLGFFLLSCLICDASEGLKTVYYESAVNGSKTINYRNWTTSRNGKVILTREERDLVQNGTWSEVDQIVMIDGKKVIHFLSLEGHPGVIYHPEAQVEVIEADTDRNGIIDQISIMDRNEQGVIGLFMVAKDGKITAASDEELAKRVKLLEEMKEKMKGF